MTVYLPDQTRTYLPGEDLTGKVGYAVKLSTSAAKTVLLCDSAATFIGVVLQEGVAVGTATPLTVNTTYPSGATIQTGGTAKVVCQAAITAGALITVHSDGRFKVATTGDVVVGRAEEAATTAGFTFAMRLDVVPSLAP